MWPVSEGVPVRLYVYFKNERPDHTLENMDLIGAWKQYQDQLSTVSRIVKSELAVAGDTVNALEGKRDEILESLPGELEETMKAMIDPSGWRLE